MLCLGDGVFDVDPCGICVGVNEFRGDGVRVGVLEIEIWLMCVGDRECRVGVSRPTDDAVVLPHLKISFGPGPYHLIFVISAGKCRIRYITTPNFNDVIFNRFWVNPEKIVNLET